MENCLFCKIIKGKIPCEKIYEDDKILVFLDINPVNPGHSLVVPKNHFENMIENHSDELHHMMDSIKKVVPAIIKAVNADGWNLGVNNGKAAGQVIFHTHFHIIPRFIDDGLKHWSNKNSTIEERIDIMEKIKKNL